MTISDILMVIAVICIWSLLLVNVTSLSQAIYITLNLKMRTYQR